MPTPEPKKKTVPLGKPLDLSDDDLDQLAVITPADILKARAAWRSAVSPEFETLLDAQTIEEEDQ